ncbi:hypothetical protein Aph01nite_63030 [Acrocarpospora phusangensis]|uniref:Uncharacterized protein n=1 Tax=Acrocarpospora phusangensis TaxID=1070424 RepID=A0A919URX5_9ACTN|nr:hypothetical protein Aph01nite_63030 [Acrocarpospora phusangensis]
MPPLRSAGLGTTRAPADSAASAMPAWSVLTTTVSTSSARTHAVTARDTNGIPPTRSRFFSGTPTEPPRAGITASTRTRHSSYLRQHTPSPGVHGNLAMGVTGKGMSS